MAAQPTGFVRPGTKLSIAPSAAALAKAQERFKSWEDNPEDTDNINPSEVTMPAPVNSQSSFQRPALRTIDNGFRAPDTPSPSGFSRPRIQGKPPVADQLRMKQKPFRSPLIRNTPGKNFISSPLNPQAGFSLATNMSQRLAVSTMPSTPLRPTATTSGLSTFQTPVRAPVRTPQTTSTPFVTPFKPGMRPGEPGWVKLQESIGKRGSQSAFQASFASIPGPQNISRQSALKRHKTFFDLRGYF